MSLTKKRRDGTKGNGKKNTDIRAISKNKQRGLQSKHESRVTGKMGEDRVKPIKARPSATIRSMVNGRKVRREEEEDPNRNVYKT